MKTLVVITGPTASGKTSLAIELAQRLGTEIVSADSRQIYRGIPIGTAVPTPEERARVPHRLVEFLPLEAYYSAARFEEDATRELTDIWRDRETAIMCGGSMLYIDALTKGIDELPTISDAIRTAVKELYETQGAGAITERLSRLDPDYLAGADPANHRRLIHALEICLEAGVSYSSLRTGRTRKRPFKIIKIAIGHDRQTLFERINRRVDLMIEAGLEEEAAALYEKRHLNSLNTVGYKELFAMMEGRITRQEAIGRIAKNTRVYAKKQLLWLSKDPEVRILRPEEPLVDQALRILLP